MTPVPSDSPATANDRFKASFEARLWGSMTGAVLVHVLLFALWPAMGTESWAASTSEVEAIRLPEVDLPPPPDEIRVPPAPVPVPDASTDVTIEANTDLSLWTPDKLPPPPDSQRVAPKDELPFTPYTVAPEVANPEEVARALQRAYPPILRDGGLGGKVLLHVYIDRAGVVRDARIHQGSEHELLDEAALQVIDVFRFRPALNRDVRVAVWVEVPVIFRAR